MARPYADSATAQTRPDEAAKGGIGTIKAYSTLGLLAGVGILLLLLFAMGHRDQWRAALCVYAGVCACMYLCVWESAEVTGGDNQIRKSAQGA